MPIHLTNDEFLVIVNDTMDLLRSTLEKKGEEYCINTQNRMHNFIQAISFIPGSNETPITYAWKLMTKHLISLQDIVFSHTQYDNAVLDEKIGDCINYLILIKAMLMVNRPKSNPSYDEH